MKRHDTHLLSYSLEEGERSEEGHQYTFNNSKNSLKNSDNNSLYSNSKRNSPFKFDNLKQNNINDENVSIISSKEIEDIFYKEQNNFSLEKKNKEKNKKLINIKINKNKVKSNENKNKNLKILKLKRGNKKEIINRYLTYSNSLINKNKKNNMIKKRICISVNNSYHNSKKNIKEIKKKNKHKNKILKKPSKSKRLKLDLKYKNVVIENDNINMEDLEENKKIKNLIDLINKQKIKSLKISKNYFSIKTNKVVKPILLDKNIKTNDIRKKYYLKFNNKIQHQNDFYLEQENNKINYIPPYKYELKSIERFKYINKKKKLRESNSSKNSLSSNNSNYNKKFCINTFNKYNDYKNKNKSLIIKTKKNDNKIQVLYELCHKNPNFQRKKIQRIRSAFSASEEKHRLLIYNKINNFQISKKKLNFKSKRSKNKKISKNNLIFYNNSYWLKKLIKLRKLTNLHHYEKHFGSTESCPLCQKMEKKNEESIREKGIQSLFSEKKNESINLNSRRIKSAISRYNNIKRSKNESINLQKNKSRNLITNKSGFNSSIINEKKNKNNITLKTNIV